jgi:hypothetical protein
MNSPRTKESSLGDLTMRALVLLVALLATSSAEAKVFFDWITIGDPGNPCKEDSLGCHGSVPYVYLINKYEVTNAQYAEFLNAIALDDSNHLYSLGSEIERSGDAGDFSYRVRPGYERKPIVFVSYVDALRFANWLHNGQPVGEQNDETTEDGAYTITDPVLEERTIARNRGARFFITSEDEWVKAGHYDPELDRYWRFPAKATYATECVLPSDKPNTANCDHAVGWIQTGPKTYVGSGESFYTDVGAYSGTPSPYGTFDQGGNAHEWLDAAFYTRDLDGLIYLRTRGGNNRSRSYQLGITSIYWSALPITRGGIIHSIRIARIPELVIDIEPNSESNRINTSSTRRLIPIAILGSAEFDSHEVDPHSLEFGPAHANSVHRAGGHLDDINNDGYIDLISHFRVNDTGFAYEDIEACVTGELFDETPLLGCDYVMTVDAD